MGFHAPQWLVREHIAFEERAVERACTIGEDGSTNGRTRARGDRRRQHGRVDGKIELEEVGELQLDARKVELHATPLDRDVLPPPVSPPTASSLEGLADHRGGCSDRRRCPGSPGDGRRAGRAPRIYRASSLARGSRRHESVGEGGAGRDRPLRPTQGVPHPTQGVRTFDNHCTGILVFGSTACGGSREVGILLAQAASSSAQRQWDSGARSALAPCSTRDPS